MLVKKLEGCTGTVENKIGQSGGHYQLSLYENFAQFIHNTWFTTTFRIQIKLITMAKCDLFFHCGDAK